MKIEEQVLSREQMARLKQLGIDTSDASMMWVWILDKESEGWAIYINNSIMKSIASKSDYGEKHFIPTYTIGDLIYKVNNLFKGFSFTDNKQIDTLYDCLSWMAKNHKELIK